MNPIRRSFRVLLLPVLAAAMLAVPAAASAQWFSPTSFWNKPLPAQSTLDARSGDFVSHLVGKVNTYGPWINSTSYSVPIWTASSWQSTQRVYIDNYTALYQGDFQSVPITSNAQPAAGTDKHMVIYQPSKDTYWEFWNAYKASDGWHAGSGAKIASQSGSGGIVPNMLQALFPDPYGATATGLPLAGGLITPQELQAGVINHVVALAIPHPLLEWWWTWPAQRSDGDSADSCDIPEGTRFRLPSSLNIASLGLSRTATIIATAVQKYGAVVRDKAGAVAFYVQDPQTMSSNPYPALFNYQSASTWLADW